MNGALDLKAEPRLTPVGAGRFTELASRILDGLTLSKKQGGAMGQRTLRAYRVDLANLCEHLAAGLSDDSEREAAAFAARAQWAEARRDDASLPPPASKGTVVDRLFELDASMVRGFIARLSSVGYDPSTVRRRIAGLSAVWRNLARIGMVDGEPFAGCAKHLPKVHKKITPASARTCHFFSTTSPAVILTKLGEARRAGSAGSSGVTTLNAAESARALRDLAMLSLCLFEGLKTGDLVHVTEGDFTPVGKTPATLKIRRGERSLAIMLSPRTAEVMTTYISALYPPSAESATPVLEENTRPLFLNKHGKRQISARSTRRQLDAFQKQLGIEVASPAEMRHAAIVNALVDGASAADVRKIFGFSVGFSMIGYLGLVESWAAELRRARQAAMPASKLASPKVIELKTRAGAPTAPASMALNPAAPPKPQSPYGRAQPVPAASGA